MLDCIHFFIWNFLCCADGSCANVFCGIGRECVEGLSRDPVCDCIERCYEAPNPVCASNNVTYDNECEMNRAACTEEMLLKVVSMGSCKNGMLDSFLALLNFESYSPLLKNRSVWNTSSSKTSSSADDVLVKEFGLSSFPGTFYSFDNFFNWNFFWILLLLQGLFHKISSRKLLLLMTSSSSDFFLKTSSSNFFWKTSSSDFFLKTSSSSDFVLKISSWKLLLLVTSSWEQQLSDMSFCWLLSSSPALAD